MAHNKEVLLNTPMNQLGLDRSFGTLFEGGSRVLTLAEFFKRNSSLFYVKYESPVRIYFFQCFSESDTFSHEKFKRASRSFQNLYELLRKQGFTHHDWVFLLDKVGRGEFDYRQLSKNMLRTFPLARIVDIKVAMLPVSSSPFSQITELIFGEEVNPFSITVEDFISLKGVKIICKNSRLRKTLQIIQQELRDYGFTQKDGPFMGIRMLKK